MRGVSSKDGAAYERRKRGLYLPILAQTAGGFRYLRRQLYELMRNLIINGQVRESKCGNTEAVY
jgi:hypothetical protein